MKFLINEIDDYISSQIKGAYASGCRDFELEIDSPGGVVTSALSIYDTLRGDESNRVSAKVVGRCFSAATIILLAAPYEKRSASPNASFLIHSARTWTYDDLDAKTLENMKDTIDAMNARIENIYNERTTMEKSVMDQYIDSEKIFFSNEAMSFGFISNIDMLYNKANVNILNIKTNTHMNIVDKIKAVLISAISQIKSETYKTVGGLEFETLELEVGAEVNLADGVYELEGDGRVITVEKGSIIDIADKKDDTVEDVKKDDVVDEKKEDVIEDNASEKKEEVKMYSEDELKAEVDKAVAECKASLEAEFKAKADQIAAEFTPFKEIVDECGGIEKLKALKDVTPKDMSFESKVNEKPAQRSLAELRDLCSSKSCK